MEKRNLVESKRDAPTWHRLGLTLLIARAAGAACAVSLGGAALGQIADVGEDASVDVAEPAYVEVTEADGERRRISSFKIRYLRVNEGHPPAAEVLAATLTVSPAETGFVAPRPDGPTVTFTLADVALMDDPEFYDSALVLIAPAVVARLQELGLIGVYVEPARDELRVEDGVIVDRRPAGDDSLTLEITTGVVTELRTIGMHERVEDGERVNNPIHDRIRERSPVQPVVEGEEPTGGNLLLRSEIDDYAARLNRHPGRRVDVAVAASGLEPGAVTLDYLVTENRPWLAFFQLSNTGTEGTGELRERFGFIHNQLTNSDDVLIVDYLTSNFSDLNAVTLSYERPLSDDGRLRGRVYGSYYTYTSSDVGQCDGDFDGEGAGGGGELIYNFYQDKDFFLDAVGGVRVDYIHVDDNLTDQTGNATFVIPYVGVRLERVRAETTTFGSLMVEFNVTDPSEANLTNLGRVDPSEQWAVLQGDISHSFYLEPLFLEDLVDEPTLAHEIFLWARGQYAFNNRLVPNYQLPVGGLYTVRGYPEAVTAGDSVFIGTVEYRYHLAAGLGPSPQPGELFGQTFRFRPQYAYGPTDWDLILKAFLDVGRSLNTDRETFEHDQTLVGAGIGAELLITRRFRARVDWGFVLNGLDGNEVCQDVDYGDNRVSFELTLVF